MTPPIVLSDLEAAADEATEGPWGLLDPDGPWSSALVVARCHAGPEGEDDLWVVSPADAIGSDGTPDAEFIAAADPPTVKALIEALRAAERALTEPSSWLRRANALDLIHDLIDFTEGT